MQSNAPVRYLAGVTFFNGDPQENQSIAPSRDTALKGRSRIAQWHFGSSTESVWLACRYLDTGISIVRRLPASYKECQLTYGPGGVIKTLSCK